MGKWCLHASSFIFDRIIIKVAGNQDRHKSLDELDFGPLVSIYMFFEMRFDLGTLDSDRCPLGYLLFNAQYVQQNTVNKPVQNYTPCVGLNPIHEFDEVVNFGLKVRYSLNLKKSV